MITRIKNWFYGIETRAVAEIMADYQKLLTLLKRAETYWAQTEAAAKEAAAFAEDQAQKAKAYAKKFEDFLK